MSFNVLQLSPDGEGHASFNLGGVQVELVTRFNYAAGCWMMDVLDADGALILAGLALVPNVDLLEGEPVVKESLGALVVVESVTDAYMNPDNLGSTVQLLWYPVGTTVVLP